MWCRIPNLDHYTTALFLAAGSQSHQASALSLPLASIYQDHYNYTEDLLTLAASSSVSASQTWPTYKSPIQRQELSPFFHCHTDQAFVSYIRAGLTSGFQVGFTTDGARLRANGRNNPSSMGNRMVIDQRIRAEISAGAHPISSTLWGSHKPLGPSAEIAPTRSVAYDL